MHAGSLSILRRWAVVDDDSAITSLIGMLLRDLGVATVEEFSSAEQALARFDEGGSDFDLIVTDRDMPGLDGLQLAHYLRARGSNAKVVLATAHTDDITGELLRSIGIDTVLAKPFSISELERVVLEISEPEVERGICLAA